MAVIPQIVTSPGAVPSTGGSQVRASPQMDVRAPTDPSQAQGAAAAMESQALQTTARAGEKLADYGAQFAEQYVKAKLNINAADHQAELSKKLHEAEFESSKIADRQKATEDYDARAAKIRDEFAAQDVNPTVRAAVDAALPNQIALRRAATQNAAFGLESKAQVGKLIEQTDQLNKQAVDAQDPRLTEELIRQHGAMVDGRVDGGHLSAEIGAKLKVDFGSNVYLTKIEVAMQKDMASGVALYEATKGKLNARDGARASVMVEDRRKQLQAEKVGNDATPPLGGYGNVTPWQPHIDSAAAKTGLPAPLIAAVASAESGGRADAVSSAGASGPMQIMPGTATGLGLKPGEEKDPAKAIPAGADYLKQQIDKFGKVEGLMAYNWGPGNVQKWIDGGRTGPVPKETQDYVATVLRKEAVFSGKGGDALAETNIEYLRNRERIARSDMDPELKARAIAVLDRNRGTMNATVQEERKATKDAADAEILKTALGRGTDGSFQQFADRYRAAGENGEAEKWQWFADNESIVKNFYTATPAQQREIAAMAPGAAGVIFQAYLSNQRADRTEFRRLASEQEQIVTQGVGRGDDPETLKHNVLQAIAYMQAAGDHEKAKTFAAAATGAGEGSLLAKLPPQQREAAEREIRDAADNAGKTGNGLSPYYNAILQQLQRGKGKYDEEWKKDPMGMMDSRGLTRTQPLLPNMTGEQLNGWAVQRARDVELTRQHTGQQDVPFLRPTEVAVLAERLQQAKPEVRRRELATLAETLSAVPGAMESVAKQLHKNDVLSANFANAMGFYAKKTAVDNEIANSLIVASSAMVEGGPAGERFKLPEKMITMIDTVLDRSRGSGHSRQGAAATEGQNWAIAARYTFLAQGKLTPEEQKGVHEATLRQAIKDVYGNIMKGSGGKEWPVPREVDQSTWKQGINNIDQTDVANLMPTANGTRITPQMIAEHGTFQVVGDGRYQIFLPDNIRGGSESQLRTNDGRPFVIDIRQLINRGGQPAQRDLPTGQRDPLGQNRAPVPLPTPAATP